jgi:hypothetical protein
VVLMSQNLEEGAPLGARHCNRAQAAPLLCNRLDALEDRGE